MIYQASKKDLKAVASLASELWKEAVYEDLEELFDNILNNPGFAIFLAFKHSLAGFGYFSLRNDYVEGTTTRPVGYVEGVYVKEEFRGDGIARQLVEKGTKWAKAKGAKEMASDCELSNKRSEEFHKAIGFMEANRIICFVKEIE